MDAKRKNVAFGIQRLEFQKNMEMNQPMNQPMTQPGSSQKSMWMWLVVGALVIVALALFWWFWQGGVLPGGEDAATTALERQGTSDEVAAIDADLQATDLDDLDVELDAIDAELAQ